MSWTTMIPQTTCPGTLAYVSLEAFDYPPVYSKKLDSFSFGVQDIQIITREFPNPGPRVKKIKDPHDPKCRLHVVVPWDWTSQVIIDLINCLSYSEEDRPSARDLCHHLAALKEAVHNGDSVQQANGQICDLQRQLQISKDQIRRKDAEIHELQEENRILKQIGKLTFSWKACEPAPYKMRRGSATVCGSMAYFGPDGSSQVLSYNSDTEEWSTLLECPSHSQLSVILWLPWVGVNFTENNLIMKVQKWVKTKI